MDQNAVGDTRPQRRSTQLTIIRRWPRFFTWGTVVKFHDIGPYTIVEYKNWHDGAVEFHIYVDGDDKRESMGSLDAAIVFAVAHKNLEWNEASDMARAACKVLGV